MLSKDKIYDPLLNPFIHGTTGSIFATGVPALKPPITMLEQDRCAPLHGEINGGGFVTAGNVGNTSFGRLHKFTDYKEVEEFRPLSGKMGKVTYSFACAYGLDLVLKYSQSRQEGEQNLDCKQLAETLQKTVFGRINELLLYLSRTLQMGGDLNGIEGQFAEKLLAQANATVQFFYLISLLGIHLHPNFNIAKDYEENGGKPESSRDIFIKNPYLFVLCKLIKSELTAHKIIENIIKEDYDIKLVVENPTPEALKSILPLLKLTIDQCDYQLFTLQEVKYPDKMSSMFNENDNYFFDAIQQHTLGYRVENLLKYTLVGRMRQTFFRNGAGGKFAEVAKTLQRRVNTLEHLIRNPNDYKKEAIINSPFANQHRNMPIILICEDDQKLYHCGQEYRSKELLQIGIDITKIATDTEANREVLEDYFKTVPQYQSIEVYLFDDLKYAKEHELPIAHTHQSTASMAC